MQSIFKQRKRGEKVLVIVKAVNQAVEKKDDSERLIMRMLLC